MVMAGDRLKNESNRKKYKKIKSLLLVEVSTLTKLSSSRQSEAIFVLDVD